MFRATSYLIENEAQLWAANWACSEQLVTLLKTRHSCELLTELFRATSYLTENEAQLWAANWACSEQLVTLLKTRHSCELQWECIVCQLDEPCTNHKNYTYLPFHIWSLYIYEIKIHIKSIYCHKFETKLFADSQHNLGKGRVKMHWHGGQWRGIVTCTYSSPWMSRL